MKTRKCSLPLVILAALLYGSHLSAQQVVHSPLSGYYDKLPALPVFPDDAALASADPASFQDFSAMNAVEKQLENLTKNPSTLTVDANATTLSNRKSSPGGEGESLLLKQTLDSLAAAVKDLQSVKIEFNANFARLEVLYNKHLDQANAKANDDQRMHPCNGNIDCTLAQLRARNKYIVDATKIEVLNEQYLLSVYQTQAKPSFKRIDNFLARASYGDKVITADEKNLIRGAQQNQIMFLNDVIDRVKLEHVKISDCVRLSQQGYRRK